MKLGHSPWTAVAIGVFGLIVGYALVAAPQVLSASAVKCPVKCIGADCTHA